MTGTGTSVKLGSVNFPKLLRHLGHRTNQVRDLVFARDVIFRKEVMTTKASSASGRGSGTTSLSGPAVSFGYEESSSDRQSAGTNAAYHVNSPSMVIPGLQAIQSPIMSRSGELERTGHRISGECTFYLPPHEYIRRLPNFSYTGANANDGNASHSNYQFSEIETYDKLIDMERIIIQHNGVNETSSYGYHTVPAQTNSGFGGGFPGYEIDRVQFKLKSTATVDYILASGNIEGSACTLKWDGNMTLSNNIYTTFDLPLRNVSAGDTTSVYKNGVRNEFTAAITGGFDMDRIINDPSDEDENEFGSLRVYLTSSGPLDIKDVYFYKEAEWRVEGIKDYRDELMEVKAVRVRGDRTSRRRAYG